jgi:hypothetical protein
VALLSAGHPTEGVEGFIPLYGHRALGVYKDKNLSPVISIHQGTVVVGDDLMSYWLRELDRY